MLFRSQFEGSLRQALLPKADLETFRDFIATRMRTYVSVDQWMEDSAKFDFSIGPRLHGNMAAWQAGTPSLWIYHDARTQELVETMALPRISLDDFLSNCESIEAARSNWKFDAASYAENRVRLRAAFNSVLRMHDIEVAGEKG